MGMRNLTDNIVLVELQREPEMGNELKTIGDVASDRGDCDVILDFSDVDIVTSQSLSKLLKLRQSLVDSGHLLVLCSVHNFTKGAFEVTGLDGVFQVVDDRDAAVAELQRAGERA